MLGLSHPLDMLGAVKPGDTTTALTMARTLVKQGFNALFIRPGEKRPAETRTEAALRKARKEAQERAKAKGIEDWRNASVGGGGIHLALGTPGKVKGAHDRAAKRHGGEPNLALALNGTRLLVVDCDHGESVDAFKAMAVGWGLTITHPTVLSPGVQDESGAWKHSSGGHFYFEVPEGVDFSDVSTFTVGTGTEAVSFMTTDCYVLVPPSRRPEGAYRYLGGIHQMPQAMVDFIASRRVVKDNASNTAKPKKPKTATPTTGDAITDYIDARDEDDGMDIDDWSAATSWHDLLAPRGWVQTGKLSSCDCPDYTAPGIHASPKSATAHRHDCEESRYDTSGGHGPLHLWTDNPPEELAGLKKTMTKLQFIAAYDYDYDVVAAMKDLGITIRDQTDYSDLMGWGDSSNIFDHTKSNTQAEAHTAAPVVAVSKPVPPSFTGPVPVQTSDEPLQGFGGPVGDNSVPTPVLKPVPTPVQDTVPAQVLGDDTDEEEETPWPAGLREVKVAGDGDVVRNVIVHNGVRGVRLSKREKATLDKMLEALTPHVRTAPGADLTTSLAVAVRRGEDMFGPLYKRGAVYDPELVRSLFAPYRFTRAILSHSLVSTDATGSVSPFASLVREMIRLAHRLPVGAKSFTGSPLTLYGVFVGASGKGKTRATDTAFSPWPDPGTYGYFKQVGGESRAEPLEDADATSFPRSGQVIARMFLEEAMVDVETGEEDDEGNPVTEPQKVLRLIPHPSKMVVADELQEILATAKGDSATIIHTLDSAYSAAAIGGVKVGDKENTRLERGTYRLSLLTGMQPSLFHEVDQYSSSGFTQRLLTAQVTWPWANADWVFISDADRSPAPPTEVLGALPSDFRVTADQDIIDEVVEAMEDNAAVFRDADADEARATHLTDMRVRIASLGALLDGKTRVDRDMWEWAGQVTEARERSLSAAMRVSDEAADEVAVQTGRRHGLTKLTAEEYAEQEARELLEAMLTLLRDAGGATLTQTEVLNTVGSSKRHRAKRLLRDCAQDPTSPVHCEKRGRGLRYSFRPALEPAKPA